MLLKQWTHVQLKTCIKYMIIYPTGFPWNEMRVVGKFRGELSKKRNFTPQLFIWNETQVQSSLTL